MSYKEMYELDLDELINTIQEKQKGLAYQIWRLASLTRSPFVKNFPETPQEACPELYPKPKGIPMPDFLKEKYIERSK